MERKLVLYTLCMICNMNTRFEIAVVRKYDYHAMNTHIAVRAFDHASHAPQLLSDNYFVGSWFSFTLGLPYDGLPLPIAGNLPTKSLVARQLPTTLDTISLYTTAVSNATCSCRTLYMLLHTLPIPLLL